jgi:hypothetical protein
MCKVDGCISKLRGGLGYCSKHYQRFKKHGDPNKGIKLHGSIEERFWRFVDKSDDDSCWNWFGQKINGYGRISLGAKSLASDGSHRVSWKMHNKQEIPKGMFVMHSCDNPSCVNPKHLSLGTPKDNSDDMIAKGRKKQVIHIGEKNGKSIIKPEIVRFIRSSDLSHAELARQLNISNGCVRSVRSKRTWKHIE